MATHYDYIVTGGGAAGLSLVARLLDSPIRDKRILLIEQTPPKTVNDRTWCFWETTPGPFESLVFHRWQHLWFHQDQVSRLLDIAPFTYKMIRGIDFHTHVNAKIADHPQVERLQARVTDIHTQGNQVEVVADGITYTAAWCFNSIFKGEIKKEEVNYLDQHFRGWFIQAAEPVFDPGEAVLMDFRTPQQGETRFLYVLPYSKTEALVEVAIFSNTHLTTAEYDALLRQHLQIQYPHLGAYSITHTEQGSIPMTDYSFPRQTGRVVHLGMAGGDTRASTGYTFLYIQRRITAILNALSRTGSPVVRESGFDNRHRAYDSLLLRILEKNTFPGDVLFARLFMRNPPARLLRFLNGESSPFEELRLMSTTPIPVFIRAMADEWNHRQQRRKKI